MPCGLCHAQTRDDHHHCSPQADFTNDIPADLLQKTEASLSCPRARLNCQPISSAEADQDAEQRELKNEKATITRRHERVNRTNEQPAVGNTARNQNAYTTQAERGKSAEYQRDDFSYRGGYLRRRQKNCQWD